MEISNISIELLANEIRNRKGVKELIAEPHKLYEIKVENEKITETGPTIILVITD